MRFNWVDLLAIGVVSVSAGIQLLRAIRDLSLIFYETLFFIGALVGAVRFFPELHRWLNISLPLSFLLTFIAFAMGAVVIASILNQMVEFSLGGFGHIFGLLFGVVSGFVFGHAALRTVLLFSVNRHSVVVDAIHRSWMASQVLYFGVFRELLAILRIARYNNI